MKKSTILMLVSLVLAMVVGIGGTLAFLTDRDSDTNVFTVGNVDIELNEDFTQNSVLMPNVEINKDAWITNKGTNPAYTWMTVAVPAEVDGCIDLNWTADAADKVSGPVDAQDAEGNEYKVYTVKWPYVINPGDETPVLLDSVTLAGNVDMVDGKFALVEGGVVTEIDYDLTNVKVPVSAFAIQSEGFNSFDEAYAAYGNQWGDLLVEVTEPTVVSSTEELNALLADIAANQENWNKDITISLAAGEYDGDIVINQYPEWNGTVGAGASGNNLAALSGTENVTHINIVGGADVVFTGNVTVNGFGNAQTGFTNAKATTTFENVTFDGANSNDEDKAEDSIVVYLKAAANGVTFERCTFKNATHVTTGGSGSDGVGKVTFEDCQFDNGGCISGYAVDVVVDNCEVTAADNGFISKSNAGTVLVENSKVNAGKYFLRTANAGVEATVNNTEVTVYEAEGKKDLVNFRGSNESLTFNGCTIAAGYTTAGVDADSTLTIN